MPKSKQNTPIKILSFSLLGLAILTILLFILLKFSLVNTVPNALTLEDGIKIALTDAGFAQEELESLKASQSNEDTTKTFEISFYINDTDYCYQIDSHTGEILEVKINLNNTTTPSYDSSDTNSSNHTMLTIEEAKSIALLDIGLSDTEVSFTKAKLETENGVYLYEIEFTTTTHEYEYEINVYSGLIEEKEIEELDEDNN